MNIFRRFLFFIISSGCVFGNLAFTDEAHTVFRTKSPAEFVLSDNGQESYRLFLDCLQKAKRSVELCPCMIGGEIFYEILSVLKERMNTESELTVHMIIQPTMFDERDREELKAMKNLFPDRFHYVFTDFVPLNFPEINVIELHIKFCIVDGKYFMFGGSNLEDFMCTSGDVVPEENTSPRRFLNMRRPLAFRDQDVVCKNTELAESLREIFYRLFAVWRHYSKTMCLVKDPWGLPCDYTPLGIYDTVVKVFDEHPDKVIVDGSRVRLIFSGPHIGKNNPIGQAYCDLIASAQRNIIIGNLYFLPVDRFMKSIRGAVNRGIDFTLISNGIHELSPDCTQHYCWGNRINYIPILYGRSFYLWEKYKVSQVGLKNTKVYEFYLYQTQYHKKVMLVDDRYFLIGSYNLCLKSEYYDYEGALVIDSEEVAAKVLKILDKDRTLSSHISADCAIGWFFDPKIYFLGHTLTNLMPA
ncbi:MAG: phosphatidylserine/phosphatidylglycerophosphate/cardiolipin synthase family protein [Victivallaceae bacterium]